MTTKHIVGRYRQRPLPNIATSGVSGAIGSAAVVYAIQQGLDPVIAGAIGMAIVGFLSGIGSYARDRGGLAKALFSWLG